MFALSRRRCSQRVAHVQRRGYTMGVPSPFQWDDPLQSKGLLMEEEIAIGETAEKYCQEHLQPRVLDASRTETFHREILTEMGTLGLLGANLTTHNLPGISTVATGLITRAIERVDSGYRSAMSVQSSLVMTPISLFGSALQQDRFLPPLASGKMVGCFGLTEPNHGSDPGSLEMTAKKHPTKEGYFTLSGSKTWITNAPIADVMLVWAKLDGKIRGFLVERAEVENMGLPRGTLETPTIKNKTGLRASVTGMIHLDNCPIPEANMLPGASGLRGPFACLNSARYGIAMGVMGALGDCLGRAREYAVKRKQFGGNPLARYQLVQRKLADAATDLAYGTLAAVQVGRVKDAAVAAVAAAAAASACGEEGGEGGEKDGVDDGAAEMVSMIKRQNCDRALHHARVLQEIFGGNAVSDEYHIGRHVANLFVTQTYEGQSDIHSLILGRAITGVQAFV